MKNIVYRFLMPGLLLLGFICSSQTVWGAASSTFKLQILPTPPSGGGGSHWNPGVGDVRVIGYASPPTIIRVLQDGTPVSEVQADGAGKFTYAVASLTSGSYIFGFQATDPAGIQTPLTTIPLYIPSGLVSEITGLVLPPTLTVNKIAVAANHSVKAFGYTLPDADVVITIRNAAQEVVASRTITSEPNGVYQADFMNTWPMGDYTVQSQATKQDLVSPYSQQVQFRSATADMLVNNQCRRADLNCDGNVNIVDFSIASYWYKKPLSPAFLKIERERLSGDGILDLRDFSMMAYYWSG